MKFRSAFSKMRSALLLTLLTLLVSMPGLSSLSVIDRDEARYAQATMQMLETGEYVDIRFQHQPRWKKPAGAYWAQAASVKVFGGEQGREIWMHRLPSVLGALLAVLATFWGGSKLVGRDSAFIGAAILAVSISMVFEAHIAKTDALLAGFSALCLAALAAMRAGGSRRYLRSASVVFWAGLGLSVMMKGPITLIIVLSCLVLITLWERRASWVKPLGFWLGPILFLVIVMPWIVLIWQKTGGQFFAVAVGEDLAPKLAGGAEKHGGPPGYYLATVWLMFWPGAAFLITGAAFSFTVLRAGYEKPQITLQERRLIDGLRLLVCWIVPWWIITEITPTKLPHYTLPVYPALALIAGAAASNLEEGLLKISRRLGAVIFAVLGVSLCAGIGFAQAWAGPILGWEYAALAVIIILIFASAALIFRNGSRKGVWGVILSGAALSIFTFGHVMPNLDRITVSKQVARSLTAQGYDLPLENARRVFSPNFAEPSLVYYLGTKIAIGGDADVSDLLKLPEDALLIIDHKHEAGQVLAERIKQSAQSNARCFSVIGKVDGENYSKGDTVSLSILTPTKCPNKDK